MINVTLCITVFYNILGTKSLYIHKLALSIKNSSKFLRGYQYFNRFKHDARYSVHHSILQYVRDKVPILHNLILALKNYLYVSKLSNREVTIIIIRIWSHTFPVVGSVTSYYSELYVFWYGKYVWKTKYFIVTYFSTERAWRNNILRNSSRWVQSEINSS